MVLRPWAQRRVPAWREYRPMSCTGPLRRGRKAKRARLSWTAVLAGQRPYDFYGPGLPTAPTSALPGTPDKVSVLAARYARREQLFHPADAGMPAHLGFQAGGENRGALVDERKSA